MKNARSASLPAQDTGGLCLSVANAYKDRGDHHTMAADAQARRDGAGAVLATPAQVLGRAGDDALVPEIASRLARN